MDNLDVRGGGVMRKSFYLGVTRMTTMIRLSVFIVIFLLLLNCLSAEASKPLVVIDDLQRKVELQRPAIRIISLSDSHTENMVAIRATKQLVGVNFSADPKWVNKNIPRLSRLPSLEQITGLKPDLVLLDADWSKANGPFLRDLDRAGIKYAAIKRPKWAVLSEYLEKLGVLSGRSKEAAQTLLLAEKSIYKSEIRSAKTEKLRVFVVAGADFSTCAHDSWGARLVTAAGAKIVTDVKGTLLSGFPRYIFYGPQKLAGNSKNIDLIITLNNLNRGAASVSKEAILSDLRFRDMPAIKNKMVREMDESDLMLPSLIRLDASLFKCWQLVSGKNR